MDVQTPEIITDKTQQRRDRRRRHLEWLGIEDGNLIELQTLAPVKDGTGFVAFTTSIEAALDLADNLTTPDRFKPEVRRPIEYQGVYSVLNAHADGMQYATGASIDSTGAWSGPCGRFRSRSPVSGSCPTRSHGSTRVVKLGACLSPS